MIAKIKDAKDSGRFEVVISTGDVDRMGESINPAGWDLEFYKTNPVVLWAHDYMGLPVGMTESVEIKEGKLVASGKFAPAEANPFAQQVRALYDGGFVRTASVGFIEKERQDNIISKAELLEWSFVPVPANPFALSTLSKSGIDTEAFITKGLIVKEEPKEGDTCTLDDGIEGEMKPNDNGELVCMPKKTEEKSPTCRMDGESKEDCVKRKIPEIIKENPDMSQEQAIAIAESICEKACEEKIAKQDEGDLATKIGAELTQMQSEIDAAIVSHSRNIIDLFSKKQNATLEDKKLQGDKSGEGTNIGREPAGLEDLEEFLFFREILQIIDRTCEGGLKKLKEKIRASQK